AKKGSGVGGDWGRDLHRKGSCRLPCSAPATRDKCRDQLYIPSPTPHHGHWASVKRSPNRRPPLWPPSAATRTSVGDGVCLPRGDLYLAHHICATTHDRHREPLQQSVRSRSDLGALHRLRA